MKAILLVSHGSRSPKTRLEIARLARAILQSLPKFMVKYAFLEIQKPSIPEGIGQCVRKGADHIVIALNFLNSGRHASNDIPSIVREAKKKYPQVQFVITMPVGQHRQIPQLFVDLIKHA